MFRLAILDSHDATRSLVRLWLEDEYELSEYANAEELLPALREKNFHLLLIELKLRMADGSDVIDAVRNMPGRPRPTMIALTASAFNSDRQRAMELGFDDLLLKPINPLKLHEAIRKYIH